MSKTGKHVRVKATVSDILSDGESAFEELRDEMESWRDSLEDKFSSTEKYERVNEAADTLANAEVAQKCEALREALELYGEGQDGQVACPPHVSGTPCTACNWDGVPIPGQPKHIAERFDPPRTSYKNPEGPKLCGSIATLHRTLYYHVGNEAGFETDKAKLDAVPPKRTLPKMRPARVHIDPEALYAELLAKEVEYGEFQAYKGRSCSRSTRLGNATAAVMAAVEAARATLALLAWSSTGEPLVLDEVGSAIDELETAIEELDGIEFPGMYG